MQLGLKDVFVISVILFLVFILVLAGVGAAIFFSPCRGQVETKAVEKCTPVAPAPVQQAEPQIIYRDRECPACPAASVTVASPKITGYMTHDEMYCLIKKMYPDCYMYNIMSESGYDLTTLDEMQRFFKAYKSRMAMLTVDQSAYASVGLIKSAPGWERIAYGHIKTNRQFVNVFVTWEADGKPHVWTYVSGTGELDEEEIPYHDQGMGVNM